MITSSTNARTGALRVHVLNQQTSAWRVGVTGLLLVCCMFFTVQAQAQGLARADNDGIPERVARQAAIVESVRNPIETLSSFPMVSDAWVEHVDQQFALSLKSPIEAIRQQTLQDIIFIANFHSDRVTLKKVVSPLLNIYLFDKDDRYRIMAVAALSAVDTPYGMRRLREEVSEVRSERVKHLTLAALVAYDRIQSSE